MHLYIKTISTAQTHLSQETGRLSEGFGLEKRGEKTSASTSAAFLASP